MKSKVRARRRVDDGRGKLDLLTRELRETRRAFSEFFELAPVSFLTLDARGRIVEANSQAADLMGFSSSWLLGKTFDVFVANENVSVYEEHLKRCRSTRRSVVDLQLSIVGRVVYARMLSVLLTDHNSAFYRSAILDITEMKETERRLGESTADWRSLVQNAPDFILKLDRHGQIIFSNRPFRGARSRGRTIFQIFPDSANQILRDRVREAFLGRVTSCEIHCEPERKVEGEVEGEVEGTPRRWYSLRFGPVHGAVETERVKATTLIIRDVTAEKRHELQLESATREMRNVSARMESVREEERIRLSRELHDELGQALTVLRMDLAWLTQQPAVREGSVRTRVKRMIEFTDGTIGTVRRIASELRPPILDDLGLVAAVEWLLEDFEKRSGIRCRFKGKQRAIQANGDHATAVFRVVQEALTNIARHSEATRVVLEMAVENKNLSVKIVDNGKGIGKSAIQNRTSLGLVGMRERVAQLGGKLQIRGQAGAGTQVSFLLPLN